MKTPHIGPEQTKFTTRATRWVVELANGSEQERYGAAQLRRILERFDLSKWTFTTTVRIHEGAIPQSHPILTLNTRHLDRDEIALAVFLHEQIHWFLEPHTESVRRAIEELQATYPDVPSSPPEGADNELSSYLHLLVNTLEYAALRDVLGHLEAIRVMKIQGQRIYRWIYRTVVNDFDEIHKLLERYDLLISQSSSERQE